MSGDIFGVSALGLVLECTSTSIPIPTYDSVEWIPTTTRKAHELAEKAVVAGYETYDRSPLWVIRARFNNDLVPGKLAINRKQAYVAFRNAEHEVYNIEIHPSQGVMYVSYGFKELSFKNYEVLCVNSMTQ